MMKRFIALLVGLCAVVADASLGTFFSDTSAEMPLDLTASPAVLKVGELVEYSPLFSSEPCDTVQLNEVGGGVTNRLCESQTDGSFGWSSSDIGVHSLELVFLKDGVEVGVRRTGSAEVWNDSVVLGCVDAPLRQLLPTTYGFVSHVALADGVTSVPGGFFAGCTNLASVTIPASVTDIGGSAFAGCEKIQSVVFKALPQALQGPRLVEGSDWIEEDEILNGAAVWRSNSIGHNQSTELAFDVPAGMTDFVFSWKVGSEANYDKLTWYLDGARQADISGSQDWRTVTNALDGAAHRVRFVYSKDGSASTAPDCGWVSVERKAGVSLRNLFPDSYASLTNVTLGAGVTTLPDGFFDGCAALMQSDGMDWRAIGEQTGQQGIWMANGWVLGFFGEAPATVALPDGVKGVVARAFEGQATLASVTIPASTTQIGAGAFFGCTGLRRVELLSGAVAASGTLRELVPDAYASLTEVVLGPEVTSLPGGFFDWCDALMRSDGMDWRAIGAQTGKQGLWVENGWALGLFGEAPATVEIPDGVTGIMARAFEGRTTLASVSIPASVTQIGSGAFAGCTGLRRVDILSGAVAASGTLRELVPDAFAALTEVTLGPDVTALPDGFFDGCAALMRLDGMDWRALGERTGQKGLWTANGWVLGCFGEAPATVAIPDGVTGVMARAFEGRTTLAAVSIPSSVAQVGAGAFSGCAGLRRVEILSGAVSSSSTLKELVPDAFAALTEVTLGPDVTALPDGFFDGCAALRRVGLGASGFADGMALRDLLPDACATLTDLALGPGLVALPDGFFDGFDALEAVALPATLADFGDNDLRAVGARAGRSGLWVQDGWALGYIGKAPATVAVPDGVRGIAAHAFAGQDDLSSVAIPDTLEYVGVEAFRLCTGLARIDLPDGVVRVDDGAFQDCTYVQSLAAPASLRTIGAAAFANTANLGKTAFADGLLEIGPAAFSNAWRMLSVSLPVSVTNVGEDAFWNCKNLAGVTAPTHLAPLAALFPAAYGSLTSVAVAAGETALAPGVFAGCAALEAVELPAAVDNVPDAAFRGCAALRQAVFPAAVTNVGAEAFAGCASLARLDFPEGLRSVGDRAFDGVARLAEVRLPAGLKTLGEAAFANCPDVRAVAVRGELGALASFLPDAFAAVETVEIAPGTASLAPGFLEGCASLRALEIPASVAAIGDRALAGCAGVSSLALPDGLRALGAHVCDGMTLLTEVAIPDGTAAIGEGAFANCPAVRRVTMPGGVVPVRTAFPDTFAQLSEVGVTPGTARLVDGFFAGCASLSEIGIPVGVSALGTGVFRDCAALVKVALPEGLSELPDESFAGCASLPSLVVPASVTRLGARVFAGCTALRSVQFLGDAPAADAAAYADAPAELVTYVADGTRGWDGIGTSRNLPEAWPAGAANAIATWTPTRLGVTFDARGGEPAETVLEETVGTTYRLPQPDPSRLGATFLGWWTETDAGAEVRPTTRVVLTGDHTLYAHWRLHGHAVAFDANGGIGEMAPVARTVGVAAALPPSAFRRAGHDFAGWALSPDGEAAFADGADPGDLAYGDGEEVTLYAVWRERAWTAADWLDAPGLTFSCAGDADWRPDAEESHDGVGSMRSGALGRAPDGTTVRSTLKTVVRGRGVLSFWWKVVCEPGDSATGDLYDYLELTVDGARPASVDPIAGETGWARVEVRIDDASAHEVAWSFVKDDWDGAVYADVAWVDEVSWTPDAVTLSFDGNGATGGAAPEPISALSGKEVALPGPGTLVRDGCRFVGWSDGGRTYAAGEAYVAGGSDVTFAAVWKELSVGDVLDAPGLAFAAGGDADWVIDSAVSHDGAASLRSGAVEVGRSCWIETSVTGAGTLSFWWKSDGLTYRGKPANYVDVSVDGVVAAAAVVTNWTLVTVQVGGSGAHAVRWSYRQTRAQTTGGACAWLDEVAWTPAPTAPGVVGDEGATVTGDAEGGFTVTPGTGAETVEVTVPDGLDAAKVTVEVPPTVKTVKAPAGAKVRVMRDGHDITDFLKIPNADASGVVDLASATVKDEIVQETLDAGKGAEIHLDDPSKPSLKTAPTKPGLVYTLREGATLDAMADGDWKVGDDQPWTPAIKVKGGASGFYSIRVSK